MSSYYKKGTVSNPQTDGDKTNIPRGGVPGQVLIKKSRFDYDAEWKDQPVVQQVENRYVTKRFVSGTISGITEERALAYSIALGGC